MASKKSVAPKPSKPPKPPAPLPPRPRARQSTIEVDPSWLDQLSEEERPRSKRSRPAPAPPSKRASAPPASKEESDETIDVNSAWLIPPVPAPPGKASKPPRPPPPAVIAVKPRGKLPPPLPRDDADDDPKKR